MFVTAFNATARTVTVDPIDWFEGKDAVKACAEDKVTETANDWCVGWYYRNNNRTTTTSPVAGNIVIRLVWDHKGGMCSDPETEPGCKYTVAEFPTALSQHAPMLATVTVTGGSVVEIREIYTP